MRQSFNLVYAFKYFTDINECSSNPCLNNGTCADKINGYVCNCKAGYTGPRCESGKYNFDSKIRSTKDVFRYTLNCGINRDYIRKFNKLNRPQYETGSRKMFN